MTTPTQLNIGKDVSNSASYTPAFSNLVYNVKLAANTPINIIIPLEADTAIFSYGAGGDVFVAYEGVAVIPTIIATLRPQEMNPQARDLKSVPDQFGAKILSIICEEDNYVTVSFYSRNGYQYS